MSKIDTTDLIERLEKLLEARRAESHERDGATPGPEWRVRITDDPDVKQAIEKTQEAWDEFDRALEAVIDARVEAKLRDLGR